MIPGANLFNIASSVIALQEVAWFTFTGRTISGSGKYQNEYGPPSMISVSFQSVQRQKYNHLGLDFNKTYKMLYTNDEAFDVDRDRAGDRFVVDGRLYEAIGSADWIFQDCWKGVMVVDVGPATDFIDYIVTTDPDVEEWNQEITFKGGVPVRIYVTEWTAVAGFEGAITTLGGNADLTASAIAIINGSEYTGGIQFVIDEFTPFIDEDWPASTGGPVWLEITSPSDMTGTIILSGGELS